MWKSIFDIYYRLVILQETVAIDLDLDHHLDHQDHIDQDQDHINEDIDLILLHLVHLVHIHLVLDLDLLHHHHHILLKKMWIIIKINLQAIHLDQVVQVVVQVVVVVEVEVIVKVIAEVKVKVIVNQVDQVLNNNCVISFFKILKYLIN